MEFSLEEIIALLIKRLVFIILCTIAGLCAFYVYNTYIVKPTYTATVQMYVNSNDSTSSANLNDLNYAQKVVSTYINFLKTKVFYQQVAEESDLNYSSDQLSGMTRILAVNNTEIFQISVTSLHPNDSYILVKTMQEVAPKLINNIKKTAEISVVDPAILPTGPSGPNVTRNTMIGGMIGFILSVLSAFLLEIIYVNVKNQEDLLKRYEIPVLGAIPNYDGNKRRNYFINKILSLPLIKNHRKASNNQNGIHNDKRFIVTEAYKSLRTNLRFTLRKSGCKKILVSSPVPEDGKSTTSTNIAITIAQTGAKVLLMDCDLRKGRLHNLFHVKSSPGISDTLSGMINENDVIQKTSHENLNVISMGAIPPNPIELLASSQMEELIKKLENSYDFIIIDSPPVNVVSDALSLVKLVDGVIIVVRERITSHPNIAYALSKYQFAEANILGFVINGVQMKDGRSSKSRYYYYHYGKKK